MPDTHGRDMALKLSEAELESLGLAFRSVAWLEHVQNAAEPGGEWAAFEDDLKPKMIKAVEAIVTARVAAALDEVEARIKRERDNWNYDTTYESDYRRGRASGVHDGLGLYARRIVREVRGEVGD
jgi:hypothetical protein